MDKMHANEGDLDWAGLVDLNNQVPYEDSRRRDGDAMRCVLSDGSDPSRPMDIDFMIACPDVPSAERIAPLVSQQGYEPKISVDDEDASVTCYCTRHMLLDYDALIAAQGELDSIARPHDGYIDGWGTFGNASDASVE